MARHLLLRFSSEARNVPRHFQDEPQPGTDLSFDRGEVPVAHELSRDAVLFLGELHRGDEHGAHDGRRGVFVLSSRHPVLRPGHRSQLHPEARFAALRSPGLGRRLCALLSPEAEDVAV